MNRRDDSGRSEGFTLLEVLMALFIGLVVLGAVYASIWSGQRSSAGVERKILAQQDVRGALQVMAAEISMASFNPTFATGIWRNPPNAAITPCTGTSANQGRKGIQEATPTSISVEMDVGRTGIIGDDNNEIIRYSFNATDQAIFRNVNCQGDVSFLGDVAAAAQGTRNVRVINDILGINNNQTLPQTAVFRYYDAKNPPTELFPATPADFANIRRIDITLGVETEEVDPATQQRKQMIYTTSVLVRNHVLNP